METLKEMLVSVKDWFKERAANPFFAAFIAAWLVLNWRVVLIICSEGTAIEKIRLLDKRFFTEEWDWPIYGLFWPLCLAVAYVLISPWIFRFATMYHRWQQHEGKRHLLKIDKEEPISNDEAEQIKQGRLDARRALKSATTKFKELEERYLEEIQLLRTLLEAVPSNTNPQVPIAIEASGGQIRPLNTDKSSASETDNVKGGPVKPNSSLITGSIDPSPVTIVVSDKFVPDGVTANADIETDRQKTTRRARTIDGLAVSKTSKESERFKQHLALLQGLSATAVNVLKNSAKSAKGSIEVSAKGSHVLIQVGDGYFVTSDTKHRLRADTLSAIDELHREELISIADSSSLSTRYEVTSLGYSVSDIVQE